MAAYILADVNVTDSELFKEYSKGVPASLAVYGGHYLVRGGEVEVEDGTWNPKRLVVIEFENKEQAKKWLNSPEYQPLMKIRKKAAQVNMILMEGYNP